MSIAQVLAAKALIEEVIAAIAADPANQGFARHFAVSMVQTLVEAWFAKQEAAQAKVTPAA